MQLVAARAAAAMANTGAGRGGGAAPVVVTSAVATMEPRATARRGEGGAGSHVCVSRMCHVN
jgi:hypothetical protein